MTRGPARVNELLAEINRFGALEAGGVERLAWSPAEIAARAWVAERASELGLEVSYDEAGNVWARGDGGPIVIMGSHLDTVPRGGRFDGALGIAAALDALGAAGEGSRRGLGLVCFTDEEGVRFGLGMMGSRAVAGSLEAEEVERARDARGAGLTEVMSAAGFDPGLVGDAAARREGVSAYLELHVEQGRRLERAGVALGVVTSIAGLGQWSIEIRGETNHAGTTAPEDRRDALQPAAALILEAQRTMTAGDDLVATVGDVNVVKGAPNVIPGRVSCVLDVRSPSEETLTNAADEILGACGTVARSHRCELRVSEKKRFAPVGMDPRVVEALVEAAAAECGEPPLLASMAGHDGMNLAHAGVPCGMLFVRSIGGISHSAQELSSAEDCAAGARALGAAAVRLARAT